MDTKLVIDREGAVTRVTFNRPAKKNALDREMYLAAIAALREAEADAETGAVVFYGAGGDFTAGNDLADFMGEEARLEEFPAFRFVLAVAAFQKPLVAAVAGDAVGVGATMLFHCDLVYASPNARFKMPFVDLGLPPEAGVSLLAPRLFGPAKAAQYLMLCESFGAEEAARLNLVNAVTPENQLLQTAMEAARRLAQKPRAAILAARRLMRGEPEELRARMFEEARIFEAALKTPELRARLAAFFAARKG